MMKFFPLVWAGLWRKPLRTLFTIGALIAAFTVLGLVKGADRQLDNMFELGKMNKMWVSPLSPTPMPFAFKQRIEELPGVTLVVGQSYVFGYMREPKNNFFVGFADERFFDFFDHFAPPPEKLAELHRTRNGIIISKLMADRYGLKEGDDVPLRSGQRDWMYRLVAVVDRPDLPLSQFSVGNYNFLNESRTDRKDTIDQFLVIIEDPARGFETARAIDAMSANSAVPTRTQLDYVRMASRAASLGDVKFFVNMVAGVTLAALLLLTANTVLQSFRERTAEFAVLKTVGFGDRKLIGLLFAETATQFVVGAAVGLGTARYASGFMRDLPWGPGAIFAVPESVYALGMGTALVLAIITAAFPAWRLHRLHIIDAMRE